MNTDKEERGTADGADFADKAELDSKAAAICAICGFSFLIHPYSSVFIRGSYVRERARQSQT
jgi:hypothetical protein